MRDRTLVSAKMRARDSRRPGDTSGKQVARADRKADGAARVPGVLPGSEEDGNVFNMGRLGPRLREIREQRGKSLRAVAAVLGLSPGAVSETENGTRRVLVSELRKLEKLYQCSSRAFLYPEDERKKEEMFRVLRKECPEMTPASRIGSDVRRLLDLFETGVSLRKLLGRAFEPTVPDHSARIAGTGAAVRQGEAVAKEERRRLGLGNAPLVAVPDLIGSQGIWVSEIGLPEKLSGFFMSHPAVGMAVVANRGHPSARMRFSYAHEYAHALFDRNEVAVVTRGESSAKLKEKRANAFAAAFLMPEEGVEEWLVSIGKGQANRHPRVIFDAATNSPMRAAGRSRPASQAITYQDVSMIALHYGVSFEAAVWRLRNLRHLSGNESGVIIGQKDMGNLYLKTMGYGTPPGKEGRKPNRVLVGQLIHLATEAFRQGQITRGRLGDVGESVGIGRGVLLDLTFATHPDLERFPL